MEGKLQEVKASYKDLFTVNSRKAHDNWLLSMILEELLLEKQEPPSWGKK